MSKVKSAVDKVITEAFYSGRVTGSTLRRQIGRTTIRLSRQLKHTSRLKTVTDIESYIYNKVIELKKKRRYADLEPKVGIIIITNQAIQEGRIKEGGKKVKYIATWECRDGQEFPYRLENGNYYLDNYFPGSALGPNHYADISRGNILLQHGTKCQEMRDGIDYKDPFGYHKQFLTAEFDYPNEQTWYRHSEEGLLLCYVIDKVYTERPVDSTDPTDVVTEIDISSYLSDTAMGGTFSDIGTKDANYIIENPKVVRMIHWQKVAILQVMYEQRSVATISDENAQLRTNGDPTCYWPYATGNFVKSYTTVSLFKLILIDIETGAVQEEDCLGSYSSWFNIHGANITGGYVDIQLDKETGHLLLIKSSSSPSFNNLSVDYWKTGEYDDDVEVCDNEEPPNCHSEVTHKVLPKLSHLLFYEDTNDRNSTYETRVYYPVADSSQSMSLPYSSYTLYTAKINTASLGFTDLSSIYSTGGSISSLQGESCTGGYRGLIVTQGPEAPFTKFVREHKVGYANTQEDFVYTPTSETEEGPDLWMRGVVCCGVFEFRDMSHTEKYKVLTTDLGMLNTLAPDDFTLERPDKAQAFNKIYPLVKIFALRSVWPGLEGSYGKPSRWDVYRDDGRNDIPTGLPYFTTLVETRFGEGIAAIGNSKNKSFVPIWSCCDLTRSNIGETDSLRNDPDNFIAFTTGPAGEPVNFIMICNVEHVTGRFTADHYSDDWWNTNSWAYHDFCIFQSFAKYRGGRNENLIYLQPFPDGRFPNGTDMYANNFSLVNGNTVKTGFTFSSTFRAGERVLYFHIGRQYITEVYDIETGTVLSMHHTLYKTLGMINSYDQFHPTPNPIYPEEWVCISTGMPAGPSEISEVSGTLYLTGIGHRLHEKEKYNLTKNAIP